MEKTNTSLFFEKWSPMSRLKGSWKKIHSGYSSYNCSDEIQAVLDARTLKTGTQLNRKMVY